MFENRILNLNYSGKVLKVNKIHIANHFLLQNNKNRFHFYPVKSIDIKQGSKRYQNFFQIKLEMY